MRNPLDTYKLTLFRRGIIVGSKLGRQIKELEKDGIYFSKKLNADFFRIDVLEDDNGDENADTTRK